MKVFLLHAVQMGRTLFAPDPDKERQFPDAIAQSLIAQGAARAVPSESPVAAEKLPAGGAPEKPVALSEDDIAEWVKLNRDDALAAIEKIPAAETGVLEVLLDVEQRNKKRVSVLEAIGRKLFPPVTD
jgi:hypothetical protein